MDLERGPWLNISLDAKDLVRQMLQMDPAKRLKANDILEHRWIRRREELSTSNAVSISINQQRRVIDPVVIRANMNIVLDVINKPVAIALNPVRSSGLAKRRAQNRSISIVH